MPRLFSLLFVCLLVSPALAQERVGWDTLGRVSFEEQIEDDGWITYIPTFSDEVQALDGQTVRLAGFMIPLDFSQIQSNFLISMLPGDGCYFHMPGGAESIAEVQAEEGVEFSYDTIEMVGTLQVLKEDPYGLLYRIVDAKPVDN